MSHYESHAKGTEPAFKYSTNKKLSYCKRIAQHTPLNTTVADVRAHPYFIQQLHSAPPRP